MAFILIACLCLLGNVLSAQVKTVPSSVIKIFKTKYPGATKVAWLNNTDSYAARFYYGTNPCTARFDSKGEWLDETKKVSFGDLRTNIKNAFSQSKFASWQAHEVEAIQEKNKEVQYRILIRNSDLQKKYIYFDSKGQLTKEVLTM
jgi:hypothetical protein